MYQKSKNILILVLVLQLFTGTALAKNEYKYAPSTMIPVKSTKFNVFRPVYKPLKIEKDAVNVQEKKAVISKTVVTTEKNKPKDNVVSKNAVATTTKKFSIRPKFKKDLTYADMDLKKIAKEIKYELVEEEGFVIEDLRVLWQSAAQNSETIKFAIYKLSNPNGDKEKKKSIVKKVLSPLACAAPMVGFGLSSPAAAGGAIIGGGVLNSVLSDDIVINRKLSKVSDTDLVMLAQEIDNLQQKLVVLYYDYLSATKELYFVNKMVQNSQKYYDAVQNSNKQTIAIADVFYRDAIDEQYKSRQNLLAKRVTLEQFVGHVALTKIDQKMDERFN